MAEEAIPACCVGREIIGRWHRQRGARFHWEMERIARCKSLEAALKIAREALAVDDALVTSAIWDEQAGALDSGRDHR